MIHSEISKRRSRMRNLVIFVVIAALIAGAVGCASMSKTQKGAAIGAASGAALGALMGKQSHHTALGAILGAAVGGAAGGYIGHYMDKQAEEMQKDIQGAKIERVGEGIKITFDSGILFDIDKAALRPVAKENLTKMAEILNKYPDTNILIEGHTDSTGTYEHNLGLSKERAQSVSNYLAGLGAARTGERRLKEMLGIDITTVQDYIHFAGMAKILFEVQHFAYSLKAQARANKKIYCIDNGLRNTVSFRFSEDEGKLAENLVFVQLLRSGATPYYWKKKQEIDFVVKSPDNSLTAINVCYSDTIPDREIEGLQEFAEVFGESVKERIIFTKDLEKDRDGISFIPLWKWLLEQT
jgi:outer membrane protein OmpA-like peptidoglycan-associated protein